MSGPEIAVVVPSHDRPLRLRWLLNALEEQTLEQARFEVVVAHDSSDAETEELLHTHPLTATGVLRHISFEPGPGPAAKRNAGWRAARAPLVAFTDDDCRPPPQWLERALAAARRHPRQVVQGTTRPDPDERHLLAQSAHAHYQLVEPPQPWAQTCNIVYPRELLERVGGFDEGLPVAAVEDTDLALRARRAGAELVAAPEVLTYHAVEPRSLPARLRESWRWQHFPYAVRANPELRRELALGLFWQPSHAWVLLAAAGVGLAAARHPSLALLALPWAVTRRPRYGYGPRGLARSLSELPGAALADLTETAAVARGGLRYRTPVL